MFNTKKTELFSSDKKAKAKTTVTGDGAFVSAGKKKTAVTQSGNGAVKYATTGNDFIDQFSSLSIWKAPRKIEDIWASQTKLWGINALLSVMFILFIRTITRVVMFWDGSRTEAPQRGSGLKHEAIGRMLWLAIYQPDTFWKNINLYIAVGSWKDIFKMMEMDLVYNGWDDKKLDFKKMTELIIMGLADTNQSQLVRKYLPSIDARSKCTTVESQARTMIAKYIASQLELDYQAYRQIKSAGTAHTWQQAISKKRISEINFDSIHGRALMLLATSKFLKNNGLTEIYKKWIESKPTAKFTGFVCELAQKITSYTLEPHVKSTLNAQFEGLIETAKQGVNTESSFIAVVDTSGSMGSYATGTAMTSRSVAQSMSVFFAKLLKGKFANAWIEFNSDAKMHTYKAKNFVDMYLEGMTTGFVGSTNFQSVINLFATIKKQGVAEEDFPTGILCLSDGEFNPGQLKKTNVETALSTLTKAGFSKEYVDNFKIVLWNIPNSYYGKPKVQFETFGDVKNVFYISGYDGSIVSFLLDGNYKGAPAVGTAEELFQAAMDQDVLKRVEL